MHAFSQFDGASWKFVFTSAAGYDQRYGLYLQDLDPETMECSVCFTLVSPDTADVRDALMTFNGSVHLLVWIEHVGQADRLRLARVLPDLTLLDPGGIPVAAGARPGSLALAARASGGMLAWIDGSGALQVIELASDGLPSGQPRTIETGLTDPMMPWVDLAPLGGNWLAAWAGVDCAPCYARLDRQGNVLSPGVVWVPEGCAVRAVSLSASPTIGFLCWRDGFGSALRGVRIGLDGNLMDSVPVVIAASEIFYDDTWSSLRRNLDCLWTGQHFAVLWNDLMPLETDRNYDAVWLQWVGADGHVLYSSPVEVTRGSWPAAMVSQRVGTKILNVITDYGAAGYLHLVLTDSLGHPAQAPSRMPTSDCAYAVWGLETRPDGEGAILSFSTSSDYTTEWWDEWWSTLHGRRFDAEGNPADGWSFTVGENEDFAYATRWDVNASGAPFFFAYERYRSGQPTQVHACLADGPSWQVVPGVTQVGQPTAVRVGERYLLIWSEPPGARGLLYKAWLDPRVPPVPVNGQAVYDIPSVQGEPYLVEGPGQLLCLFAMTPYDGQSNSDIYALRLGLDGAPLDPAPILVANHEAELLHPHAVWDGSNYLVAWEANGDKKVVYAGRLTAEGVALDGGGYALGALDNTDGHPRLSSHGDRIVAVAFGSRTLRVIFDDPPTGVGEPLPAPSNSLKLICTPSPARDQIRVDAPGARPGDGRLEVLDLQGRLLLRLDPRGSGGDRFYLWDGRLADGRKAPAGMYPLRLSDRGRVLTGRAVLVR